MVWVVVAGRRVETPVLDGGIEEWNASVNGTKELLIEGEVSAACLSPLKERLIPCDVGRRARCSAERSQIKEFQ
jgi:hypothetical protein